MSYPTHAALHFCPMATGRPDVVTIERAFNEEELQRIESLCAGLQLEHVVEGPSEGVQHNRRDLRMGMLGNSPETAWFFLKLMRGLQYANVRLRVAIWGIAEHVQYRVYEQGRDCWHLDSTLPEDGMPHQARKLTFELLLSPSNDYEGGDRHFLGAAKFTAARGRGTLVVFPSFQLSRVYHVTAGARRSLEGWVCGPEFR